MTESSDDSIESRPPLAVLVKILSPDEARTGQGLVLGTKRRSRDDSERGSKRVKVEDKTGSTTDLLTEGDKVNLLSYNRSGEGYDRKQTCYDFGGGIASREQRKKISYVDHPVFDPELAESDSDLMLPPRNRMLSDVQMLEKKLLVRPWGPYGEDLSDIVEIFSISVHWNDKENTSYRLYGNLFFDDMGGYCQRALERSLDPPIVVSNGENLPLHGLFRCLWVKRICRVFVCLMGHGLHGGSCWVNECDSKVLIKEKHGVLQRGIGPPLVGYTKPMQKTIAGSDKLPYLKIHYSVAFSPFIVGLEVKLVAKSGRRSEDLRQILIDGRLSVRWMELEEHMDGGFHSYNYDIMLLDTQRLDSGGFRYVHLPVGTIPVSRRVLAVPRGFTLVFESDVRTSDGDTFSGHLNILVDDDHMRFEAAFEGLLYNLQIHLLNYFVL